jgi:hypothetical protein
MLLDGDKPIKVPWRESYLNPRPDPETRYMALCVLSHIGSDLIFLAACSDSLLRYAAITFFAINIDAAVSSGCFVAQKRKSL